MKLPKELDSTEWAEAQNKVFAGEAEPRSIFAFNEICIAQEAICPTNLTIRHRLILLGGLISPARMFLDPILEQFHALHKNGYWAESKEYWNYTLVGLEWYRKRHGLPEDVIAAMDRISASYEAIKPCPLPECSEPGSPLDGPEIVSTDSYFVKRWKNPDGTIRAYLLIALNTDPEPRANLHRHLEAGYFAFWTERGDIKNTVQRVELVSDGEGGFAYAPPIKIEFTDGSWLHRCKEYTAFNFKESFTSSSLVSCLPKGAMPPTWRAKPPRVKVVESGGIYVGEESFVTTKEFHFSWNNGLFSKQTRTIEVLPDRVVVTDGGFLRRDQTREYRI